jgi:general L-amino acid transport system substrate-binding protein
LAILAILAIAPAAHAPPASRLAATKARGYLNCGVEATVPGFVEVDRDGRYHGFDVDICRAVAAAIFGTADKVRYTPVPTVDQFLRANDIDLVARRLTWELKREAPLGLLFGPTTFFDGQGFLVSKQLRVTQPRDLANTEICVARGTVFESNLDSYLTRNTLAVKKVLLESATHFDNIAAALSGGTCRVYSADVSELGAIRSKLARPADFAILSEQISREPLAPLVRGDDSQFFTIVRWTVFALINAEELGVTSKNVDAKRKDPNPDIQRLLGVIGGEWQGFEPLGGLGVQRDQSSGKLRRDVRKKHRPRQPSRTGSRPQSTLVGRRPDVCAAAQVNLLRAPLDRLYHERIELNRAALVWNLG